MTMFALRSCGLAFVLLATTALNTPAFAQSIPDLPPPDRVRVDENGVDLARGTFTGERVDLAIGPEGRGGLALIQRFGYTTNVSQYDLGIFVSGSTTTASLGRTSIRFTQSGSTYTPADGSGASLVKNGNNYILTAADGTVVTYDYLTSDTNDFNRKARATSIAYPTGERLTLTWVDTGWCSNFSDGCSTGTWINAVRLQAVSSSLGYQLHYNYARDTEPLTNGQGLAWRLLSSIVAINTTVESCSPAAGSCTLTQSWPTVSYSGSNVTDPEGRTSTFAPNNFTQTFSIRRPSAASANVVYQHAVVGSEIVVTSVTRDGLTWSYNRTVNGTTATMVVTEPGTARSRTIVSNLTVGLPTSVTDELGHTTSYQYDASGRLTRITAPEGNYVQYSYDARGNVTQTRHVGKSGSGVADIVASAVYPASCSNVLTCNQPTSTTDARSQTTDYTYNASNGAVATVTAPAPSGSGTRPQTRFTHTAMTAPGGGTVYRLTAISQCQTLASCAGQADEVKTTIAYAQANLLPSSVTSGSGNGALTATSTLGYDNVGRQITVDGPLAGMADTARTRYNLAGQVVGTVSPDPDGAGALKPRAQRTTYNSDGQVSRVEAGNVNSQSDADWANFAALETADITYDSSARPIRQTLKGSDGAIHAVTDQSYDSVSRPDCSTVRMNPAAWATVTAACTAQAAGSSGADRITRTSYDAANQVTQVTSGYGTSDAAVEVTNTYSNNDRLATVTDAEGNRTTYEYDGHDRLVKTRFPSPTTDGVSSTTDYEQLTLDPNGNVTNRRLRDGQNVAFTYDALNRATLKNLPGTEPDVTYTYDLLNRLIGASATGNSLTFTYDALGRNLTQVGALGTATSAYDAAGRRTQLTYPGTGLYINYDYNTAGDLTAIRENGATSGIGVLAAFAYDDRGRRTSLTRGNGAVTTYSYDPVSRRSQLFHNMVVGTGHDLTLGFTYNPANQIATNTRSNDAYAWTNHYGVNRNYTADGLNRYTAAGSIVPTFDARGNLTSAGSISYVYNSENMLRADSIGASFAYDPLLRLYHVVAAGGGSTLFAYDGDSMIAEYNASYVLQRRFVHGPGIDEPLVWYEGSGSGDRRWLHADERGSIIAVSNGSGTVTNVNAYDEYGIPQSTNVGRFQYTGQAWLPELGMYYYRARMYSPTLGRFMQTDPIGYAGGMNLYAYVGGDPINLTDPSGLTPETMLTGTRIPYRDGSGCGFCSSYSSNGAWSSMGGRGELGVYKVTDWDNASKTPVQTWIEVRGSGDLIGFFMSSGPRQGTMEACIREPLCGGSMSEDTSVTLLGLVEDPDVRRQMVRAWVMSFGHEGRRRVHEHGFWIGNRDGDYHAYGIQEAAGFNPAMMIPLGAPNGANIYFHTHPFRNLAPGFSAGDVNWAYANGVLSIVLSHRGVFFLDYRR